MKKSLGSNLSLPIYINEAKELVHKLKNMDVDEIATIMKLKLDKATEVKAMYDNLKFDTNGYKAIEAYDGLQYKNINYSSLSDEGRCYIDKNVFIYSALYGINKADDSIYEHRLDFSMKIDLYKFWDNKISKYFFNEVIIDLASNEFVKCMSNYDKGLYYQVQFKENKDGKLRSFSTASKQLRGKILHWLAENNITKIDDIKMFNADDYYYSECHSTDKCLVFVKDEE